PAHRQERGGLDPLDESRQLPRSNARRATGEKDIGVVEGAEAEDLVLRERDRRLEPRRLAAEKGGVVGQDSEDACHGFPIRIYWEVSDAPAHAHEAKPPIPLR